MRFLPLLPLLLLTACQNSYQPDMTLKKAWSIDLESTQQPNSLPYGLLFEHVSKKVIYIAASHMDASRTNILIEKLIKKWRPQIILCQGDKETQNDSKTILRGISADRAQIKNYLQNQYGIDERDYEIYSIISLANQVWQFEVKPHQSLEAKVAHHLTTDPSIRMLNLSYEDIRKWFYKKMGYPLTEKVLMEGSLTAPKDPNFMTTSYLQKISFYQDEIDDAVAMSVLAKALEDFETIMIIRAGSKYVTEREVLHKMLGTPTELLT